MDLDSERRVVLAERHRLSNPAGPWPPATERALEDGRRLGGPDHGAAPVQHGAVDRVRRRDVGGQVVLRAGEREPPTANPPGPRRHDEAAPVGVRPVAVDEQVETVDGEPSDPAAGVGVDPENGGATVQVDHENSPEPPRRRNTVRSGRSR
jgi:hypothetical protein